MVVLKVCWFRACGLLQDDHITTEKFPVHLGVFNSGVRVLGRFSLSIFQSILLLTLSPEQCEWLMSRDLGLWWRSRNKSSARRTTGFCLLSQSCKTKKRAKAEIKGHRNNGVGMEKENQHLRVLLYKAEIWVPEMGERHKSSFQNFLMQGSLILSLDWGAWRGKDYSSISIPQHLLSLSTFSLVHQSQKVALCDDKYSLRLPAEARVLCCKSKTLHCRKSFLKYFSLKKKCSQHSWWRLPTYWKLLLSWKTFGLLEHFKTYS